MSSHVSSHLGCDASYAVSLHSMLPPMNMRLIFYHQQGEKAHCFQFSSCLCCTNRFRHKGDGLDNLHTEIQYIIFQSVLFPVFICLSDARPIDAVYRSCPASLTLPFALTVHLGTTVPGLPNLILKQKAHGRNTFLKNSCLYVNIWFYYLGNMPVYLLE